MTKLYNVAVVGATGAVGRSDAVNSGRTQFSGRRGLCLGQQQFSGQKNSF